MFSMMIGDAPIAAGAPLWVVPVRSRHCATDIESAGTGVAPHIGFEQLETGVLSQTICAWYPPGRLRPNMNTPGCGFAHVPGQVELTTVAPESQLTVQMYAIPPVQ